jgi:hypothetical protein
MQWLLASRLTAAVTAIPVVFLWLPPGNLLDLLATLTSEIEYHLDVTVRSTVIWLIPVRLTAAVAATCEVDCCCCCYWCRLLPGVVG